MPYVCKHTFRNLWYYPGSLSFASRSLKETQFEHPHLVPDRGHSSMPGDRAMDWDTHSLTAKFLLLKWVFGCVSAYTPEWMICVLHRSHNDASFYAITIAPLKATAIRWEDIAQW